MGPILLDKEAWKDIESYLLFSLWTYTRVHYNSIYTYIGTETFVTGALFPVFVAQHQDQFYLHKPHWYIMYLAIPMYGDLYVYEFFS